MGKSKSIDNVPERISIWLNIDGIERACREGWFSEHGTENLIIKSCYNKWKTFWAFYI